MLWVNQLSVTLSTGTKKVAALKNVSFDVQKGEFLVLLGPSGSGKTTLLNAIAGFQTDGVLGEILYDEQSLRYLPPHKRGIGFVFQRLGLLPSLRSVRENILVGVPKGSPLRNEHELRAVMERVQLEQELVNRNIAQLSGGQQQRVSLARMLISQPKLRLLDEPLSNLDARLRRDFRKELRSLHEQDAETISIYVTHDSDDMWALADKVAVLEAGSLMQIGTPEEVFKNPQAQVVRDLVQAP